MLFYVLEPSGVRSRLLRAAVSAQNPLPVNDGVFVRIAFVPWVIFAFGCQADVDPLLGRWVGSVVAFESEYYADSEAAFVGSSVELQVTRTEDGRRVAAFSQGARDVDYLSGIYLADPDAQELGPFVSWALEGDTLTGAAEPGAYALTVEMARFADLSPQEPDALDGQWLVEARSADSDCVEVGVSDADARTTAGIAELTSAGATAVWRDPIEHESLVGTLGGSRFEGDYVWKAVTETGEESNSWVHAELDLEALVGIEWSRSTGSACYGYNLAVARLADRLDVP